MAGHKVPRAVAFEMLRAVTRNTNVRLAAIAVEIVSEADHAARPRR